MGHRWKSAAQLNQLKATSVLIFFTHAGFLQATPMRQFSLYSKMLVLTASSMVLLATSGFSHAIEKPQYDVVFENDQLEYRLYQPYLVAITTVENSSSFGKAANTGFMRLFSYITGDNTSNSDIAMTAPVQQSRPQKISMTAPVQQIQTAQGWSIAFMLPSSFSMQNAPSPTDPLIRIEAVPARLMAVIRYSGRWTERNFSSQEAKLRELVEDAGITLLSTAESAVYNPPFMPPFMRHNEVMFEVSAVPIQP
ncbi:MAG: hypothetical protein ACI95C_002903 [Pseudohongiellaceae bacterium]